MRDRIDATSGDCWIWIGAIRRPAGYGQIQIKGDDGRQKSWVAHRIVWDRLGGSLDGQLHHLCGVKPCVCPSHLELLTPTEHSKVHHPLPTHCPYGHEYTEENTYWRLDGRGRQCRPCNRRRKREWEASLPIKKTMEIYKWRKEWRRRKRERERQSED